ncbi:MAG: hypothetical protein ABI462_04705 [Ignavibacteria bacterium]
MKTIISFIFKMFFLATITVTCFTQSGYSEDMSGSANSTSVRIGTSQIMSIYGDVNFDGIIDLSDFYIVLNDNSNFVIGNPITDLNGDGITNLNDVLIVYNLI